jgi:hypothetical protein
MQACYSKRCNLYFTVQVTKVLLRLLLCEFVWITKLFSIQLHALHKKYQLICDWVLKSDGNFPQVSYHNFGVLNTPFALRVRRSGPVVRYLNLSIVLWKYKTKPGDWKSGYVIIVFIIHTYMDFVTLRKVRK